MFLFMLFCFYNPYIDHINKFDVFFGCLFLFVFKSEVHQRNEIAARVQSLWQLREIMKIPVCNVFLPLFRILTHVKISQAISSDDIRTHLHALSLDGQRENCVFRSCCVAATDVPYCAIVSVHSLTVTHMHVSVLSHGMTRQCVQCLLR